MRKITPTIILMTLYMCVTEKSLSKKRLSRDWSFCSF